MLYFLKVNFQYIPKQSVYFTYYLYAASYMLLHSSAYNLLLLCLLLYCVYVYHYFVQILFECV